MLDSTSHTVVYIYIYLNLVENESTLTAMEPHSHPNYMHYTANGFLEPISQSFSIQWVLHKWQLLMFGTQRFWGYWPRYQLYKLRVVANSSIASHIKAFDCNHKKPMSYEWASTIPWYLLGVWKAFMPRFGSWSGCLKPLHENFMPLWKKYVLEKLWQGVLLQVWVPFDNGLECQNP